MNFQYSQSTIATFLTICLFSISQQPVFAISGTVSQTPLFVAAPVQPNIFFMLDDSGSMLWNLTATGGGSISFSWYVINPSSNREWRTWCLGSNALAYNPSVTYKPWAANMPGTSTPYPDQTDLTSVWSEPTTLGIGTLYALDDIDNHDTGSVDLSSAPIVKWMDAVADGGDGDGVYDTGECASAYTDSSVMRADELSTEQQINFANWFTYYRNRNRTVKSAVSQVIASSSARMGVATLHGNNSVGKAISDMTEEANKANLLSDIAKIRPSGGTPLRTRLNWVGEYFDQSLTTPSQLNIGSVDSPILPVADGGECQQNFVMLMTDGAMNGGNPSVGNQDSTVDNDYVYPAHQDSVSNELADVAMKWYKKDLSPYDNKVPVQTGSNIQNLDENNKQHLVTFTVAFGLSDTLNDPLDRTQAFTWPPNDSLADVRHAAYNGRGKFLSAGNPEVLANALQNVITDIESRKGSASAVSFNTSTLLAGTSLFFASFDTIGWKGDVRAFTVNQTTGELSSSATWSAANELASKNIPTRTIYTWGLDSSGEKDGVLFDWSITDPQPAANILADFKINADLSVEATPFTESIKRLNYIRGNQANDGVGLFRDRLSLLGDIVHSAPRFVGEPVSNWPDSGDFGIPSKRYSTYQFDPDVLAREKIVYVGANDGLLHGFKASDGEEVFAYLPSSSSSTLDAAGLHYFTEIDYQHRYYVDGLPVSADVYMPIETAGDSEWRTILVGALGGGGQGLYALDVSKPSDFNNTQVAAKSAVLWEYTNQDDDHLGFSFSTPQVTLMNNGEWAVIIGNGYNATGTDHAELKIIFIAKGLDGEWATAGDVRTINTGKGTTVAKNGLSTPSLIDLDGNGTTDRIYAGDLLGNMWAFDVSNSTASSWNSAYLDTSSNPAPLFTATHYAGDPATQQSTTPQAITMQPLLVKVDDDWVVDDSTTNKPNVMVYFGTGQYVATGDAANTNIQSFYGVWDANAPVPASKLVEQTFISGGDITSEQRVVTQNSVTFPTPPTVPSTSSELGWFINLTELGERVVVNAFEHRGLIYFNTMTPSISPCSAGGTSWLMAVDMKNGGEPTIVAFDVNNDGEFNNLDLINDGSDDHQVAGVSFTLGIASATSVITNQDGKSFAYTSGTGGDGSGSAGGGGISLDLRELPSAPPISGTRRSWIQLFN